MGSVLIDFARIIQNIAEAKTFEKQIQVIIESICSQLSVAACYLYVVDQEQSLRLVQSYSLLPQGGNPSTILECKRLLMEVVATGVTINVPQVPVTTAGGVKKTDGLKSLCALPLMNSDKVMGVLVVRDTQEQSLDRDQQSFLIALSAQLVLLLSDPANPITYHQPVQKIKGIKGASGMGIGQVQLCRHPDLFSVEDVPCADIEAALEKWHSLLAEVKQDIQLEQSVLQQSLSESANSIFTAYHMLLSDPLLTEAVEAGIRAGNWLPGALRDATEQFADVFLEMDDPYLQARFEDIKALGNKLYEKWQGIEPTIHASDQPIVLVGSQISLSHIASVSFDKLAGLVCFDGSALSHTAILANGLGIPAVMGVGALTSIKQDKPIIVDGDGGYIIVHPSASVLNEYKRLIDEKDKFERELAEKMANLPVITTDGAEVALLVHSGLVKETTPAATLVEAAGIGLCRTETQFMLSDSFPSEQQQIAIYQKWLQSYAGKPVYMRILDVGGDKALPYFSIEEDNPALGWRGVRFCLDNTPLLTIQVRAMLKASVDFNNLHILLPMVSAIEEIKAFRKLLKGICRQLLEDGWDVCLPPVGIMLEVPAVISQLHFWRPLIDFVSVGSNDLSQYLLAVDRNNSRVSSLFDALHPAILAELRRIVGIAESLDLPISLCGEMACDPEAVVLLLGLGFRSLTMSHTRLPRIKWLIRHVSLQQCTQWLQKALGMESASEIRQWIRTEMQTLQLNLLGDQMES